MPANVPYGKRYRRHRQRCRRWWWRHTTLSIEVSTITIINNKHAWVGWPSAQHDYTFTHNCLGRCCRLCFKSRGGRTTLDSSPLKGVEYVLKMLIRHRVKIPSVHTVAAVCTTQRSTWLPHSVQQRCGTSSSTTCFVSVHRTASAGCVL